MLHSHQNIAVSRLARLPSVWLCLLSVTEADSPTEGGHPMRRDAAVAPLLAAALLFGAACGGGGGGPGETGQGTEPPAEQASSPAPGEQGQTAPQAPQDSGEEAGEAAAPAAILFADAIQVPEDELLAQFGGGLPNDGRAAISGTARNPNTPPSVLAFLAAHPDKFVRIAAAANPNLGAGVLAELARDDEDDVRVAAAQHPNTPPDVLALLADDPDGFVRQRVAANPNTPPDVLAAFASDTSDPFNVSVEAARNPSTPPAILAELAAGRSNAGRYVGENPGAPADLLAEIGGIGVAANPGAPVEVLARLANSDARVRQYVAANPSTPIDILVLLASDPDDAVRYRVAENPNTPPDILAGFAADSRSGAHSAVAANPSTPADILESLAGLGSGDVRFDYALAGNPSTPAHILEALADHPETELIARLVDNPGLPQRALIEIAVRRYSAPLWENYAFLTHDAILLVAAELEAFQPDPALDFPYSGAVSTAALLVWHPLTPLSAVESLASSPHAEIREMAASSPRISADTLTALTRDSDPAVRRAATEELDRRR